MQKDGPDRLPQHRMGPPPERSGPVPRDLLPVGATLRRPPPRQDSPPSPEREHDPLSPWQRRLMFRAVSWLARRFEAARDAGRGEAAGRYGTYAALLRRVEGDLMLHGTAAEPPVGARRRGHLTVVDD